MSVWSKLRDFVTRHKSKFIVTGVIVTSSILITKYAQHKLREWQEEQAKEFLDRTRKQQHFESTDRICNQTILNLLDPLLESLMKTIDTDEILNEIKKNPKSALNLWQQLKIKVFAKATCFIYVSVILSITCRIQLGILGGYLYKNSELITPEIQEKYLSLCHNLLNEGLVTLSNFFEEQYSNVIGSVSLKEPIKLITLEKIFWEIQTLTKNSMLDPIEHMKQYILPKENTIKSKIFDDLIQETADILESDEIKNLATSCVNRGFILLGDNISEFYKPQKEDKSSNDVFVHPSVVEVALAKLIPIISGLMTKNSFPEQLIQQLIINDKLKVLSANIYEAFS